MLVITFFFSLSSIAIIAFLDVLYCLCFHSYFIVIASVFLLLLLPKIASFLNFCVSSPTQFVFVPHHFFFSLVTMHILFIIILLVFSFLYYFTNAYKILFFSVSTPEKLT
ncbi:hypothetical protein K450DRAFT_224845 [Umbelopsis ramanniana AG]|uniref:Uncharacterized protein n=1 Tax=Umbelopsis ramanniana AG TaxID=1314678 RepID=A0AAD5EGH6_UMBRA|nr:uncharacterized protein K450DRAFT_224845 [Umbelopsis ramanniana AG]KAI8582799.1 hypothetical protein K450DRAFT_224845 [Umbelopsis ramanniana AG]